MSDRIVWLEDLTQGAGEIVGRKCANLGELTRAGFQVPPGFALSLSAYEEFLETTGAGEEIRQFFCAFEADPDDPKQLARFSEASTIVRQLLEAKGMPASIADPLADYYEELCVRTGVPDVAVATRSAGPSSHPGQYESFLNVAGRAEVEENVKKVWSSTFNTRSLVARARKGLPLDFDPIGVAVLKMVDADAAGVMFTAEPTTADASRMIIEGSRGLGESVVSGAVIPDNWTVDIGQFTIVERRPAPGTESGCLFDEEVIELARIGKRVEAHFGKPQDIEWAVDRGARATAGGAADGGAAPAGGGPAAGLGIIYVLQARAETFRINFRF